MVVFYSLDGSVNRSSKAKLHQLYDCENRLNAIYVCYAGTGQIASKMGQSIGYYCFSHGYRLGVAELAPLSIKEDVESSAGNTCA